MMKIPKRPDQIALLASIAAATQTLRSWVLAAAAMFVGLFETYLPRGLRMEMRAYVRDAASDTRRLVVMCAAARWRGYAVRRRAVRPGSTPPGFRWRRARGANKRRLKRGVRLHGRSIAQRIAHLRAILANLKAWTARMLARLDALTSRPHLAAVCPPADVRCSIFSSACACADTS